MAATCAPIPAGGFGFPVAPLSLMSTVVRHTPQFTPSQLRSLAQTHFGISADAVPLPGDRDQNVRLDVAGTGAFVLKVANPAEDPAVLAAQHRILRWIEAQSPSLHVPRVVPGLHGDDIVRATDGRGVDHQARLLSFVSGTLLADLPPPRSPALLSSVGKFLGRLTVALDGFDDPAVHRVLEWDVVRGPETVREKLSLIESVQQRELVTQCVARFEARVISRLPHLRRSVIHNDGNDHNLLVRHDTVSGVIDFGDVVHSITVAEVAVGGAYAMLDESDPLLAAGRVVAGFAGAFPLTPEECEILFDLMLMRLAISVSVCAEQKRLQPRNPYLTVSERPAWSALERLVSVRPEMATAALFAPEEMT